jgi:hypothetical protein
LAPIHGSNRKTPEIFARYAGEVVDRINSRLDVPLRWFITINEPNMLVLNSYLGRQFPARHRGGFATMMRAYDGILRAHLLAYREIHEVYRKRDWPAPSVTFNNYCSDLYWSDKMLLDLVCARERGVQRLHVGEYICKKRANSMSLSESQDPAEARCGIAFGDAMKRVSNWIGYRSFDAHSLQRTLDTLYLGDNPKPFDYIGLDYYDPFAAHCVPLAGALGSRIQESVVPLVGARDDHQQMVGLASASGWASLFLPALCTRVSPAGLIAENGWRSAAAVIIEA